MKLDWIRNVAIVGVLLLPACSSNDATPGADGGMATMSTAGAVPTVDGFAEGQAIKFIHTEASDPAVADMLTKMMGSPVILVPELAQAPSTMLANVYVFTNGIKGMGPLGYQSDVFDNPPGMAGYRPLRALVKVTWKSEPAARVLESAADVSAAETSGEVTIARTNVVINMPLVTWPGGQR